MTRIKNKNKDLYILKDPVKLVYADIEGPIGMPSDVNTNLEASGACNFD
jgi:hypothetical protein